MAQATGTEGGSSSRFELIERLDEQFMFLLQFFDISVQNLTQDQQNLAKKWLVKLGSVSDAQSIGAKLQRNAYLDKLMECITDRNLKAPFNNPPQEGDLPVLQTSKVLIDPYVQQQWLDDLITAENNMVHVGGKDFETYLSAKLFEDGRGACAYLAVSTRNEGDKTAWLKICSKRKRNQQIIELYTKELCEDLVDI